MTLSDAKDIGAIVVQLITVWMAIIVHKVKKQTNGLVKHNEDMAREAGKAEEKEKQRAREDVH